MDPSIEDRLRLATEENERLRQIVTQCNADWSRLKAFIVAGRGPEEMCRFQDAAKKNGGVGIFLEYLVSLWAELDKRPRIEPLGNELRVPLPLAVCDHCWQLFTYSQVHDQ